MISIKLVKIVPCREEIGWYYNKIQGTA